MQINTNRQEFCQYAYLTLQQKFNQTVIIFLIYKIRKVMNPKINQPENLANCQTEVYEKPQIEIIEMEMEGSILAGSGGDYTPGGGSPWS